MYMSSNSLLLSYTSMYLMRHHYIFPTARTHGSTSVNMGLKGTKQFSLRTPPDKEHNNSSTTSIPHIMIPTNTPEEPELIIGLNLLVKSAPDPISHTKRNTVHKSHIESYYNKYLPPE